MKIYRNITWLNGIDLDQNSLLLAVKEELAFRYPDLSGDDLFIVTDLMVTYDEDVTEENGQFSCYSCE